MLRQDRPESPAKETLTNLSWATGPETSKSQTISETSWRTTFRPPNAVPCREADSATTAMHRPRNKGYG